ncbi:MAG: DUF3109 family protein [Melioribacteraceae bacterium]|nr:DUF3109 family protein [Melioribacteraceae bacterium]
MINLENIDGVLVSKEILNTKFTCDLKACKGACCTMKSEFGAPLTHEEIKIIEKNLSEISKFLSEKSLNEIKNNGFWEEKENELMTRSINDEDCVFVFYEDDVAKCAIERAYNNGKIDFIKPISCHLFPIRVSDFGGDVLRYEKYADCQPALKKGEETNLSVLEFCEIPIKRKYNNNFYNKLEKLNGK